MVKETEKIPDIKQERNSFIEQLESLKALDVYVQEKIAQNSKLNVFDSYESEETKELYAALAKAQGEFPRIGNNKENPYFKNSYADLDYMMQSVRGPLAKNGLSIKHHTEITPDGMTVLETKLCHSSGQWSKSRSRIIPVKNDPQSIGSYRTYMERYGVKGLLNITTTNDLDDDDAEVAMVDLRDIKNKGVALNNKYNPKEQGETITKEQLEEIEYELASYDDIADMVLDGLKIQSLADMPKSKYQASLTRIRTIKMSREGLTEKK